MTKSTGEDWVGAPALARELGIMLRTLYKILDSGELPSYKLGRVIRIKRSDVEAYLESVKVRPGDLAHLYGPGENDQGNAQRAGTAPPSRTACPLRHERGRQRCRRGGG